MIPYLLPCVPASLDGQSSQASKCPFVVTLLRRRTVLHKHSSQPGARITITNTGNECDHKKPQFDFVVNSGNHDLQLPREKQSAMIWSQTSSATAQEPQKKNDWQSSHIVLPPLALFSRAPLPLRRPICHQCSRRPSVWCAEVGGTCIARVRCVWISYSINQKQLASVRLEVCEATIRSDCARV